MASIKGINIEIGATTSKLTDALKNVNSVVQSSNKDLRELNKALKLDPKNTETVALKQKLLRDNIEATKERLEKLKTAQKQMGDYNSLTEEQKEQYKNLSIEIAKSEANLKKMNNELEQTDSGDLSSVNNEMEKVGHTAIKVGDLIKANLASEAIIRAFDSIVGKVKDVASGIGKMVVQGGMDRALNLENAKAKMSTFTKDSKQLDEIMNNVSDSVDGTAFSMDSAATVAAGFFAAGIKEGPQMTNSLKLVGDAAQVSGRSMEEIGAIFNKVAANGKLSGQELNQLSDSGIPILQMLSKTTGKSAEEVRKLVSDGKIGFAEFSKAMEEGLGGAAQKSGETFTSSLAKLPSEVSLVFVLMFVDPITNDFVYPSGIYFGTTGTVTPSRSSSFCRLINGSSTSIVSPETDETVILSLSQVTAARQILNPMALATTETARNSTKTAATRIPNLAKRLNRTTFLGRSGASSTSASGLAPSSSSALSSCSMSLYRGSVSAY